MKDIFRNGGHSRMKNIQRNAGAFLKVRGGGLKTKALPGFRGAKTVPETGRQSPSSATLGAKGKWLSNQEHRVDALALRADERRDKLRKAAGSCTWATIRRYLNGETRLSKPQPPCTEGGAKVSDRCTEGTR